MSFNGPTLKAMRVAAGVSQAELAEFMGYFSKGIPNRSMISRMEKCTTALNPRHAKLAEVFLNAQKNAAVSD